MITHKLPPNFRDLGGHPTANGTAVTPGRIFRSSQLSGMPEGMVRGLEELGIRFIYDFRTAAEREQYPDVPMPGVQNVWLDVLSNDPGSLAAMMQQLLQEPRKLSQDLTPEKVEALYGTVYENLVSLPGACKAYGAFFSSLLQDSGTPRVFHCTAGKDRTGWAAAMLLLLLGVSHEDVLADYLASNEQLLQGYSSTIEAFVAAGGDRAVVESLIRAHPEYLEAGLASLMRTYESISNYFSRGLGISLEEQSTLILAYTS
ncbi:tyrosine-protein phosphatase [Pusillimonas sp. CC-YST705]|uniref:Tyrosine-protein phosphatase n=1 Tax=Mesopusillimonas faecipullorum TaxID=2755040 RepID=A0ABS8C9M2_9BURK|nr:tyrosine-protein phosphatase [Mesopusillimonas faecipullorum]MCB5362730.1 tyrosine-protein phosphatase [Mesopusillimonas faecipullorum]